MRLVLATTTLAASATILFGCDSGAGAPAAPTGNTVQIDQFAARYAQTSCAQNFKCDPTADLTGRTLMECMADNTSGLSLLVTLIKDGSAKQRVSYDAAKMGACITAIEALSCTDWKKGFTVTKNQPEVCKTAVVAKVPAGGACQEDLECTTAHCEGVDFSVTPVVDGKCITLPVLGASCAALGLCADGLYCDDDSTICLDKKPAGVDCTTDDECLNSCNLTTGQCSSYVGCAVSDAAPRPALLVSLLIGVMMLFGLRRGQRRRNH